MFSSTIQPKLRDSNFECYFEDGIDIMTRANLNKSEKFLKNTEGPPFSTVSISTDF